MDQITRDLIAMVEAGRLVAAIRPDGQIAFWHPDKAPAWAHQNSLSAGEIRRICMFPANWEKLGIDN